MNKILVIILSFTILFQSFNLDFSDFGKIPTLVNHIVCHFETGDSFGDFISMHYGSQFNMHKNEHNEHKELPFKHKHIEAQFQYVSALFSNDIFTSFNELAFAENKFAYNEPTSNSFVNSFSQPPQK